MFTELKILICGSLLALLLNTRVASGRYVYNPEKNTFFYESNEPIRPITASWRQGPVTQSPVIQSPLTSSPWRGVPDNAGSSCARIYEGTGFQGKSAAFQDSEKNPNWGNWYNSFKPSSVRVSASCSVTLYDYFWRKQAFSQDSSWIWGWNYPVVGACCECGGCAGVAPGRALQCARLYEHDSCNGCDGFRLDLKSGDRVRNLGPLDNVVSSLIVREGCYLISHYERDFTGFRVNFTKSQDRLGDDWNKHMSSVECFCPGSTYVTPRPVIYPTTSYPVIYQTPPKMVYPSTYAIPNYPITYATSGTKKPGWITLPTQAPTPHWTPPVSTWTTSIWTKPPPTTTPVWPTTWATPTALPALYTGKTTPTKSPWGDSDEDSGETKVPQLYDFSSVEENVVLTSTKSPFDSSSEEKEDKPSTKSPFDSSSSEEDKPTTKPTFKTTTESSPLSWSEEDKSSPEEDNSSDEEPATTKPVSAEVDFDKDTDKEDNGWSDSDEGSEEATTTMRSTTMTTTTTTPKPTTTTTTKKMTTTTEKASEEEGKEDDWDNEDW